MPGLVRRLRVDVSRLEAHARELISSARREGALPDDLCADVRADAYGHSLDLVKPALQRSGFTHFHTDNGCESTNHNLSHVVIDAETLFGVGVNGAGPFAGGFTTLVGEVVNVKRVPAGQRISYGYTYSTEAESTVALVALGYADGVARRASNIGSVQIAGRPGTIAGRIAMDQFVVDMKDAPVAIGDEVIVWGSHDSGHPSLRELAMLAGIAPLALTSLVGYRVVREASGS